VAEYLWPSPSKCELERLEGILSQGGEVDIEAYARSASHLRRILESLEIERAKKDVTPSLTSYLERNYSEEAAA
jgi:hypothetical protein